MTSVNNEFRPTSIGPHASIIQGNVFNQHLHQSHCNADEFQRTTKIADWFSPTLFAEQQTDHISRREPGTGRWFLNHSKYRYWCENANTTLFCPGIPGSGKSMMVSTVVDDLQVRFAGRKDVAIIYIYYNFNRQAEQGIFHMLATLIRQLFQEKSEIPEAVQTLFRKHQSRATRASEDELKDLLRLLICSYNQVFVVLDALDECQNAPQGRDKLFAELFSLQAKNHANLNILATSRPIPNIEQRFLTDPRIEIRAHNDDLEAYLANHMDHMPQFVTRSEQLQQQIKSQIVEAAEGMFLLARLQFDSLGDKLTPRKLKDTLAQLAKGFNGLDNAYRDALERIGHQRKGYCELARKVLMWITYARRELSIEELQEGIAIEPGSEDLDQEDFTDTDEIVSACQGLVQVDQKSRIIRLVHYTTKEYFDRVREQWLPNGEFHMTQICLVYLSMSTFGHDRCYWYMDFSVLKTKYRLLEYVGKNWALHARAVNDEELCEEILQFLNDARFSRFAGQLALARPDQFTRTYRSPVSNFSLIHIPTILGLGKVVRAMIENDADMDAEDSHRRTPLSWAAGEGHIDIVKLLLARPKVNINVGDKDNRTPLSWAAGEGHTEIVQLLVARAEIDSNIQDKDGRTPLYWATEGAHNDTIRLLLAQSDTDVNTRTRTRLGGQTPFFLAFKEKGVEIIRLFLKRPDVKVDIKDKEGRTPLFWAAEEGHHEMVQSLLDLPDVDVNARDMREEKLLDWAIRGAHQDIVQLLLARSNPKINARYFQWVKHRSGYF